MLNPVRHCLVGLTFAAAGGAALRAQAPPLLTPVATPPAAAVAWDLAERARSMMIVQSAFVRVDTAVLTSMPLGGGPPFGTVQVDLFTNGVQVAITGVDATLGYRTFRGQVPGQPSAAHFVVAADGTTWASLSLGQQLFVIAPTGVADVHVLQLVDPSLLPKSMASCGVDASHAVAAPPVSSFAAALNTDCDLTTIDILVFYTPAARQNAGGVAAMEAAIVGAIDQANTGHLESGAPIEFRLVHMAETNYTEVGSSTDLARFRALADGFMDEVHALRDTYGGDLMHLLIEPPAGFCGVGYLMTNLSTGFESSAFAVTVRTCIPNQTFTHECGHNMGCHHDIANAGPALFPYSYGYRTPDNAYRTIMAYAPGARINRWSSPNVQYLGYTMGAAGTEDNVLSIANACTTVAQFRGTTAPRWCDLDGGIAGAAGVPALKGAGTINLAQPLTLAIGNYGPVGVGVLVVGAAAVQAPVFGGTLWPSPDVVLGITGSGADIVHNANWLASQPPGFQAWFQAAFLDFAAAQGLSASDAVRVTVP